MKKVNIDSKNLTKFYDIKCQSNLTSHSSSFFTCKTSGLIYCSKCAIFLKIPKYNLIQITTDLIPFLRTSTYVKHFILIHNYNIGLCSGLKIFIKTQKNLNDLFNEIKNTIITEEGILFYLENPQFFEELYKEINKEEINEESYEEIIDGLLPLNENTKKIKLEENKNLKKPKQEKTQKIGHKIKNENIISMTPINLSSDKNSSSEVEISNIINLKDDDSTDKNLFININKSIPQKNIMILKKENNKSNLLIYNPLNNTISLINISQKDLDINLPFEKSKQISYNNTLYITGGVYLSNEQKKVYKITYKNRNYKIKELSEMLITHSSHNITFIPDKNYLIVCGGSTSKNCEYLDVSLDNNNWKSLNILNQLRGNATMFSINNRFIYCVGGFDFINKVYCCGYELYDLEKSNKWEFLQLKEEKFMISTMGVIKYDNNEGKIFLLGGFSNIEKKNDALRDKIEIVINDKGEFLSANKKEVKLPHRCLFYNSQDFIPVGNNILINFTHKLNLASFNLEDNSFNIFTPLLYINYD